MFIAVVVIEMWQFAMKQTRKVQTKAEHCWLVMFLRKYGRVRRGSHASGICSTDNVFSREKVFMPLAVLGFFALTHVSLGVIIALSYHEDFLVQRG